MVMEVEARAGVGGRARSQWRAAKMEAGDPSVSVDLLLRSLLALGARPREIARAIERPKLEVAG